ncbi:glycoside hydrolase family 26 protein [Streptomyces argyrophylli]|uniref:glycoside hydrolase family 26 protein n=1 Tax=Streptomyces argyrophylli TaxID=2726118 RepID=UPI001489A198|nr:glycosyl hydrolase [Streptomyces argyrophyllae]
MAPQQRRARAGRPATVIAAALFASAALAAGPGLAVDRPGPTGAAVPATPVPTTPTTTAPSPSLLPPATPPVPISPPSRTPVPPGSGRPVAAFGAFLDSGPRGVARMAELSHWLGGTELKVAHTYLPGGRWQDIEGAPGFLDAWAQWRREKADRMLVLNVPMQERNEENLSDAQVRWLLRQAAGGAFDHHFKTLAERLVELRVPDTVIVLGWEMNGITYTHRCGPDPAAWKTYWNRIVATMRSVPRQRFRFDFTPSRGRDAVPWTECYPGDATVDIIGMDAYDQPSGLSFDEQVTEPYGLQQHVDFAKAHGKAVSYPEWGLFRNGDNPEYMRRMLDWIDEHRPLYNTLTDYCPHGVWQCSANPRSSRIYRAALYGRGEQPAQVPTPPPAPAPEPTLTTEPAKDCSPPALAGWVAYWLGESPCAPFD